MSTPRQSHPLDRVAWANDPTPQKGMHVPLLRPAIDRPLTVVAIGDACQGVNLHHDGQKTMPCLGSAELCEHCREYRAWRRYWFLLVATLPGMKLGILSITDGAWKNCPALMGDNAKLRGRYVKTWRTGRAINGPQHVQVGQHCGTDKLPAEIDLRAQLLRIWGYAPDRMS